MNKRAFSFTGSMLLIALALALMTYILARSTPVYAVTHPKVITSFSSPGAQVRGLAWGDNSLWLVDANQNVYRLSADGEVQATFPITIYGPSDLAWYENSLWVSNGSRVYQLNSSGQVSSTIDLDWASAVEWIGGYLYTTDTNFGYVHKYNRAGNHLLSWELNPWFHPVGMTFDGMGLWLGDYESRAIYRFSLTGTLLDTASLDSLETCDYTCYTALAWDGQYLWYAGKYTVYRLDITGLFVDANTGLTGVSYSDSAWGDYDGDGDLDIAIIGLAGSNPTTKIYRNDGNNVFTDIHATIANVYNGSVDWGDYDNDGDLDILLTGCADASCGARTARIYRNLGNGNFSNVTTAGLPGVAGGDAAWGDYDNDGDLDILLMGHNGSTGINRIYRNDGNGVFTGFRLLDHYYGPMAFELYNGSVAWGDYDNDGDLDAVLAGCYTATCYQTSMDIYRNDGNNTFTVFTNGGARYSSVAWGDYDNDGYLDILLTGSMGWAGYETCKTIIYHNSNGTFTDIGVLITGACQGSADWGDYDNDGDLDIVIAGDSIPQGYNSRIAKVYRNDGNGDFTDIEASLKEVYFGSVDWGDYDGDRDLDILLTGEGFSIVYRNGVTTTNTAPTAPTGLHTSSCSALFCNLMWNTSSDDHTPATSLTYNVRVGTTPGGVDIVSPMAITNTGSVIINGGYRLIPQMGNAGETLEFHLSGLDPETTYYWSVQAIDTAYEGSSFSTGASFTTGSLSRIYLPLVVKQ